MKMKNETPLVTVPSQSLGMKALPKILLALTAVAALSVAHPAKANLITNPGFEAGHPYGWTIFPVNRSWVRTQNGISPHSGNVQLYYRWELSGGGRRSDARDDAWRNLHGFLLFGRRRRYWWYFGRPLGWLNRFQSCF